MNHDSLPLGRINSSGHYLPLNNHCDGFACSNISREKKMFWFEPTPKGIFARDVVSWVAGGAAMGFMTYYTLFKMVPFLEMTLEFKMETIHRIFFLIFFVPVAGFGGKIVGRWLGEFIQGMVQVISACKNNNKDHAFLNV